MTSCHTNDLELESGRLLLRNEMHEHRIEPISMIVVEKNALGIGLIQGS